MQYVCKKIFKVLSEIFVVIVIVPCLDSYFQLRLVGDAGDPVDSHMWRRAPQSTSVSKKIAALHTNDHIVYILEAIITPEQFYKDAAEQFCRDARAWNAHRIDADISKIYQAYFLSKEQLQTILDN